MDLQAIFSDQSPEYMRREGERIFLCLRTLKGQADRCVLMAGGRRRAMKKIRSGGVFDYYEGSLPAAEGPLYYYFRITLSPDPSASAFLCRRIRTDPHLLPAGFPPDPSATASGACGRKQQAACCN